MPSVSVLVDDTEIATAGARDLNLLSASLCGGPFGEQSLIVSGIGHTDETESEHLTWVGQQIRVGQIVDLRLSDSDHFSTADRSVTRGGIDEITKHLESMNERMQKRTPAAPPAVLYPNLYYSVRVNSKPSVEAFLNGFDQIQAEIMWSYHKPEFDFGVMSISVKRDGSTTHKNWLQTTLKFGDRIRIIVLDAPSSQANIAAISVA